VKIGLTRRYRFSASHRLHSEQLSEPENWRVYGKCNNPYGHGHNYVLEVTVAGPVDQATGMIANLADLDNFVAERILEPFDLVNLNEDTDAFRKRVPTTENLCLVAYERLKDFPLARVSRIRIEETSLNSFEYSAEPQRGNHE
jgi:6-pyruvoyltetrahydropterin/6-carboxytetrahydropterin synthase